MGESQVNGPATALPLPIFLILEGRRVLLVGHDLEAAEKARLLQESGAILTIVTGDRRDRPEALLKGLPADHVVDIKNRPFRAQDVNGMDLVIATPSIGNVQSEVADASRRAGVICNTMDRPESCDFFFPAVHRSGELQIAVSTNGQFPLLAARLRDRLGSTLSRRAGEALTLLGAARRKMRQSRLRSVRGNTRSLATLLSNEVLEAFQTGDIPILKKRIREWLSSAH